MADDARAFGRWGLWALPVWAILLFLGTITHQPDSETEMTQFAEYVTTDIFLVSHLVASIVGAAVGSIGAVALLVHLQNSRGARRAIAGVISLIAANTLMSSVFGIAAFAQPAIGRAYLDGQQNVLAMYNSDINSTPLFVTAGVGLLLFAVGGVLLGSAIAASGRFPRWTGWATAVGIAGFAVSFLLLPLAMSLFSPVLFLATVVMAWKERSSASLPAGRKPEHLQAPTG